MATFTHRCSSLIATSFVLWPMQTANADELLELKTLGRPQASPELNAIFGVEVGGSRLDAKVADFRKAEEASTPPGTFQQNLIKQTIKLQEKVDDKLHLYVVAKNDSILRQNIALTEANMLAVTTRIQQTQQYERIKQKEVFENAARKNAKTLHAALTAHIAQLSPSALNKVRRGGEKASGVVEEILNSNDKAFQKKYLHDISSDVALGLIKKQLESNLPTALKDAQGLSGQEIKEFEGIAKQGISILMQTVTVVDAFKSNEKQIFDSSQDFLNTFNNAATSLKTVNILINATVESGKNLSDAEKAGIRTAVQLGQQFLQGGSVSAPDLSLALSESGIDIPNKSALVSTFEHLTNLSNPQDIASGLNGVKGYLALAQSLNIQIDPQITQTVETAQVAANIAVSFVSGNYLGAIEGLGGLFGGGDSIFGGGGRAAAERKERAEIQAKLDVIISLQRQTLAAIGELSKQLAQSTALILDKLENVQDSINYLVEVTNSNQLIQPLNQCRKFVNSAMRQGVLIDGHFTSYKSRKAHFDVQAQTPSNTFVGCQSLLSGVGMIYSGNPRLQPTLWLTTELTNARQGSSSGSKFWQYDTNIYFPMVSYTTVALKIGKPTSTLATEYDFFSPCSTKFIGALAVAPTSFHQVHYANMACDKADGTPSDEGLRLAGGTNSSTFLKAGDLTNFPVNTSLISEIAEFALFLHPYQALIDVDSKGNIILLTEDQIALKRNLNLKRFASSRENLSGILDMVNVAISQETLLSGVYASDYASVALRNDNFGRVNISPSQGLKDASRKGCGPNLYLAEQPFSTTACMLAIHPEFARNVAMHLVLQEIRAAEMTLTEYSQLFDSGEATYDDVVVSFPNIYQYLFFKDGHWFIRVNSSLFDSGFLLLPLPTAANLVAGSIAYPEVMRALLNSRASLIQQMINEPLSAEAASLWTAAKQPVNFAR